MPSLFCTTCEHHFPHDVDTDGTCDDCAAAYAPEPDAEPDYDLDAGFDPYLGAYTDDC